MNSFFLALFASLHGFLSFLQTCQNSRKLQGLRYFKMNLKIRNGKQEVFALQCWQACQLRVT